MKDPQEIEVDGKSTKVARKRLLADLLWQIAATGKATFPDGTVLEVSPNDYLGVVKFIYQHIDGPPKTNLDVTSGGETIDIKVIYDADTSGEQQTD